MKIILNNQIVDTENIFSIGDISCDYGFDSMIKLYFVVDFFNDKKIHIGYMPDSNNIIPLIGKRYFDGIENITYYVINDIITKYNLNFVLTENTKYSWVYADKCKGKSCIDDDARNKILAIIEPQIQEFISKREELIKLWSNNQTTIPKFNF